MNKQPSESLRRQGQFRDSLLDRIVAILYADKRVLGAWLSGSFGLGEEDKWSDLDLQVAVEDSQFGSFLQDRPKLYSTVGDAVLIQEEMPSDNLTLGGALYLLVYFAGGVMVDWNFGPAGKAEKPAGHRILFERRAFPVARSPGLAAGDRRYHLQKWTTFFWAMAPIAVKYAARGATRHGARQTDLLARALICLQRLLMDPTGPDPWLTWMNRPVEDVIDSRLARLGAVITPQDILDVIGRQCALMIGLQQQLAEQGVDVHPAMVREPERLVKLASEVVSAGDFPARRYR